MKYVVVFGAVIIVAFLLLPLPTNKIPTIHLTSEIIPEARLVFGGDMMFDRYIRQVTQTVGGDYVFSCIDQALVDADRVVANLEGPITINSSVSIGTKEENEGHYTFTFPPETAELLARHNVSIVNLGNNHIMNFGLSGLRETKQFLESVGVLYFGDPEDNEEDRVLHEVVNGIPFAFVVWSDWTSDKTDHTVHQVGKEVEAGNIVVVYAHWGDEYVEHASRVEQLAHSFIDAGASVVVGSHPHVVESAERYKGKYIYYSLGNFIFDQYFNEAVQRGLLLSIVFTKEGVESIKEIPIELHTDGRTCVSDPVVH